ncbi:protein FAR1-RELATED SEQUENCE 5-like [Sesbania bispinosa]|nr:protein FAR1-RELATED SEQUENCE 5-like [Sesbania bispinosa]
MRLRGRPVHTGDGWGLNVVCCYHNHDVAENLEGHAYAGRLTTDELSLLNDMTKNMVKPRNILLTLKDHNKDNVTTIKQIYNARRTFRSALRGPWTELQNLMKLMDRDNYVYWHRRHKDSDVVRDIVWTHPDAMKLLNIFHIVLIIVRKCTYKINMLLYFGQPCPHVPAHEYNHNTVKKMKKRHRREGIRRLKEEDEEDGRSCSMDSLLSDKGTGVK